MPSINCFTRYRSQRWRWGLMIIFLRLILRIDFGLLVVLFILRKDFFYCYLKLGIDKENAATSDWTNEQRIMKINRLYENAWNHFPWRFHKSKHRPNSWNLCDALRPPEMPIWISQREILLKVLSGWNYGRAFVWKHILFCLKNFFFASDAETFFCSN